MAQGHENANQGGENADEGEQTTQATGDAGEVEMVEAPGEASDDLEYFDCFDDMEQEVNARQGN